MNLQGSIPEFILIFTGKSHDVHILNHLAFQPGAFYVMDRAYLDYERLYAIDQAGDEGGNHSRALYSLRTSDPSVLTAYRFIRHAFRSLTVALPF